MSADTHSWYRDWFNSPYYDLLYRHRDEEEAALFVDHLVKHLNPSSGAAFLDAGCGKGRHAVYLSQKGYAVTGIDISEARIREAQTHAHHRLQFEVHDMRKPFRPQAYDYVLNFFTSFGYFPSEADNIATVQAFSKNLKAGGQVVIDFLNVKQVVEELVPAETKEVQGITFELRRTVEGKDVVKHIRVTDGKQEKHFRERVQLLMQEDFERYFEAAGLELQQVFGNYHLQPFDAAQSKRLILVAGKR